MLCKNCNAQIPDDSIFCPECGQDPSKEKEAEAVSVANDQTAEAVYEAVAEKEDAEKAAPAKKEEKPKKSALDVVGIAVGIFCIVFGVIGFIGSTNNLEGASFGADFYTYTYDGIYVIAGLMSVVAKSVSALLIGFGTFMTAYFAGKAK